MEGLKNNTLQGIVPSKLKLQQNGRGKKPNEWVESYSVQMVGTDVSTKKQQYARDGPLHYVPVNMSDAESLTTLKDIISAKLNLVGPIDLLESERGPSMRSLN